MIIRHAGADDLGKLARIHRLCFEDSWTEDFLGRILAEPGIIPLVASDAAETELQAFILIRTVAQESEILTLATAPEARRKGFARALLIQGAAEAARKLITAMFLEVAEDNGAALALYRQAGFLPNGRRRLYYRRAKGDAVDALLLQVNLPLGHGNDARSRLNSSAESGVSQREPD